MFEKIIIIGTVIGILAVVLWLIKIGFVVLLQAVTREKIEDKIDESLKPKPKPPQEPAPSEPSDDSQNEEADEEPKQKSPEPKPEELTPVEYIRDLSQDYLKKREHVKTYPIGVSPVQGKHYRFERNAAVYRYFCYLKGWAYLGDLLPKRTSTEYEKYFFVRIPRTSEEVETLRDYLSTRQLPIILSEDDVKILTEANGEFDLTVNMSWFQRWCWNEAQEVYIYWKTPLEFFTMRPQFRNVHFSLPIQGDEGSLPVFENRREKSMNHVATEVPYAKRNAKLKDALGVEFTIEFIISGYCENPWLADNEFQDVFTQNDMNIRGSALKIASELHYLPQMKNTDSIDKRFESLLGKIKVGEITKDTEVTQGNQPQTSEEFLGQHKARIQQHFQEKLLVAANLPEHYTGFVWLEVTVMSVYPSGPDAETIIELENNIAEAEYAAQTRYIELTVSIAEGMGNNLIADDATGRRIAREVEEIQKKGAAQAGAVTAMAKAVEEMKKHLGPENTVALLMNKNFTEALQTTGSNIIVSTGNGTGGLNDLVNFRLVKDAPTKKDDENPTSN